MRRARWPVAPEDRRRSTSSSPTRRPLTLHGRLPAGPTPLERLRARLKVVPIPAPLRVVRHIARMWPVDGVVGDNCALVPHDPAQVRCAPLPLLRVDPRAKRERSGVLRRAYPVRVPGRPWPPTSSNSEADVAIDFCETFRRSRRAVRRMVLFEEAGATAKVSSIHVNSGRVFDKPP